MRLLVTYSFMISLISYFLLLNSLHECAAEDPSHSVENFLLIYEVEYEIVRNPKSNQLQRVNIHEWHDRMGQRQSRIVKSGDDGVSDNVYRWDFGQHFEIMRNQCVVSTFDDVESFTTILKNIFNHTGWVESDAVERGIPCTCWKTTDIKFCAFEDSNIYMPLVIEYSFAGTPILISVKSFAPKFSEDILSSSFDIPMNLYCIGLKQPGVIGITPKKFVTQVNVVTHVPDNVDEHSFIRLTYDRANQLIMEEISYPDSSMRKVKLHDIESAITYTLDKEKKSCTKSSLMDQIDENSPFNSNSEAMNVLAHLLSDIASFYHVGQRKWNEVLVDQSVGRTDRLKLAGVSLGKSVNVHLLTVSSDDPLFIPKYLRLVEDGDSNDFFVQEYYFTTYEALPDDASVDSMFGAFAPLVMSCYTEQPSDRLYYTLEFSAHSNNGLKRMRLGDSESLLNDLKKELIQMMQVRLNGRLSALRLQAPIIQDGTDVLKFSFGVMETEAPLAYRFLRLNGTKLSDSEVMQNSTKQASLEECTAACEARDECQMADYNLQTTVCRWSDNVVPKDKLFPDNSYTTVRRTLPKSTGQYNLKQFANAVEELMKDTKLYILVPTAEGPVLMVAKQLNSTLWDWNRPDDQQLPPIVPVNLNKFSQSHQEPPINRTLTQSISVDECGQACLRETKSGFCYAFVYEPKIYRCSLAILSNATEWGSLDMATFPHAPPTKIVYTLNSLGFFAEQTKTISREKSDDTGFKGVVKTEEECVRLCMSEIDTCYGIDLSDEKRCYVHNEPLQFTSKSSVKVGDAYTCQQRPRVFKTEFSALSEWSNMDMSRYTIFEDKSEDDCAQACVASEQEVNCQAYYTCQSGSGKKPFCALVSYVQTGLEGFGKGKDTCVLHERSAYPGVITTKSYKQTEIQEIGISPGGAAGVCIVMLLLGVGIAALATFFVRRNK